ncbi:MAG: extracellular solute-binding protein [Synechococcaceae cyanobacterium]|nr:extracellular solute-binding protein [Synechococcaceae cyanobacterium]
MPRLPLPLPCRRRRRSRRAVILGLAFSLASALAGCRSQPAAEIGVYSGRHYNTDKELYRAFTARTGIRVRLLEGKDSALIERVRNEGTQTRADVLVLVDAARLDRAARLGLLQPIRSAALERDVPEPLRDPEGRWFALTRRVRLLVLHPSLGEGLARSYEDLARPELRGRLCLRDSRSVYNQSLVADQLIRRGEADTAAWVRAMVANLGQPLFSSDIPLARAVARGECGAALVNSYYVARMLAGEAGKDDQTLARRLRVVIPDPAHVNVSGAGVTRHSRQAEAATRLIEFLASPEGGRGYAAANHEYPLRGVSTDPILQGFGPLRGDGIGAAQLGERNAAAVALMQANGWR